LPAERALAQSLGVSRSTVTVALDELRADRIVESRQGSGTVVHGPHRSLSSSRIAEHFSALPGIDLAAGNPPDPSHWPAVKIDVSELIAEGGGPGVQPLGLEALRRALAERHTREGLLTEIVQVHVTAGAHQATSLVVGACTDPGDFVAVDDTSYPGILDIIENVRARTLALTTDGAGVLPEAVDGGLSEQRAGSGSRPSVPDD